MQPQEDENLTIFGMTNHHPSKNEKTHPKKVQQQFNLSILAATCQRILISLSRCVSIFFNVVTSAELWWLSPFTLTVAAGDSCSSLRLLPLCPCLSTIMICAKIIKARLLTFNTSCSLVGIMSKNWSLFYKKTIQQKRKVQRRVILFLDRFRDIYCMGEHWRRQWCLY